MMKRVFLTLLLLATSIGTEAKVTMPAVFGDNMVLQQRKAALWGHSDAKRVEILPSWCDKATTVAVKDGEWRIEIPTPEASFDKHSITISDTDSELVFGNVLVGEVWVCSGQSNMFMTLRGYRGQPVEGGMQCVLNSSKYADRIRMITMPKRPDAEPQWDIEAQWEVPSTKTSPEMSAVAYFFAQTLGDVLDVPVGIISTSWGGSRIEAWMDRTSLTSVGIDVDKVNSNPKRAPNAKCSILYNGMVAPVAGYTARGFTWYQGESNRNEPAKYAHLMELMVKYWRAQWGDEENRMPFLYVQIAPYYYNNSEALEGPLLIEAQADALKLIPNSAMVSTTDVGEKLGIHPGKKRIVAERLVLEALQLAYGHDIPDGSAPQMESVEFKDGQAIVRITNGKYGLYPVFESAKGFEIAGEDGVFHPAKASVSRLEPQVTVSSDKVEKPVAVRYSFHNYTPGNLTNNYGLPLVPFRSDRE